MEVVQRRERAEGAAGLPMASQVASVYHTPGVAWRVVVSCDVESSRRVEYGNGTRAQVGSSRLINKGR
jgi:hypothetical protein